MQASQALLSQQSPGCAESLKDARLLGADVPQKHLTTTMATMWEEEGEYPLQDMHKPLTGVIGSWLHTFSFTTYLFPLLKPINQGCQERKDKETKLFIAVAHTYTHYAKLAGRIIGNYLDLSRSSLHFKQLQCIQGSQAKAHMQSFTLLYYLCA